jgi:prophage tail gpP-like protein
VEGRDFMGLLLDSYCEPPWKTVTDMKLKALAELLLTKTPFINRKTIVYQENVVGKLKGKRRSASSGFLAGLDTAQKIGQIEAGMTIFDVLKNYSLSRGMLFYCLPDGTLVFGRPLAKGAPEYTLTMLKSGKGNNVIESEVEQDISRRYSKYTVVGQQQGSQAIFSSATINTVASATDTEFPFYKPFVACDNNDNLSPKERARVIMEKHRREGTHLVYTVGRHSQNGQNWAINRFCRVKDEKQYIDGDYLIYGRTFEMDKQTGPITKVKLGVPGAVA